MWFEDRFLRARRIRSTGMAFSVRQKTKPINLMGNLLYVIAVILFIGWLIGFFAFSAGSLIHILLVIAIIAVLFNLISGSRTP
jgi:hypothetical protein